MIKYHPACIMEREEEAGFVEVACIIRAASEPPVMTNRVRMSFSH
jgi:hypothetical protein